MSSKAQQPHVAPPKQNGGRVRNLKVGASAEDTERQISKNRQKRRKTQEGERKSNGLLRSRTKTRRSGIESPKLATRAINNATATLQEQHAENARTRNTLELEINGSVAIKLKVDITAVAT